ncbi:alpha/beta hydrolase-fold protein [Ornithinimicrobium faecis]|uniref:Alpha/beta hydrolase-fold protein n=1 Tax=Ornithinimicrobium faecis TaxID=2934158 RepID=A0ABY4YWX8_9MICO|nr:alpha/beta hydrolase-fold protein [Ornithinimicrobium sp. HY1793]USQ81281.1 alpha/beta hydrolase-fold protein [Ornithinimicrobium sp. HY1793]
MSPTLVQTTADLSYVLPGTTFYEFDSERVGARFGVWVTLPLLYDQEERDYPLVFQPDGNKAAPTTAPPAALLRDDPINPIKPFIQVSVGYVGEDARRLLAIRARDLLPPGEPLSSEVDESMLDNLPRAGMLSRADARLYLDHLRDPHADRFLAFLTEELDPALRSQFRVSDSGTGLHGFSYGGLFASYAALSTDHFEMVGAGSPGILHNSTVLDLYDQAVADESRPTARHLHVTVCERELTYPSTYQDLVGRGAVDLVRRAGQNPVQGMDVTAAFTPTESHATGSAASWFSFLRECYAADSPTSTLARVHPSGESQ